MIRSRIVRFIVIAFIVPLSFIVGCENKQKTSDSSAVQEKTLSARVDELEGDVAGLQLNMQSLSDGSALVSTQEKGYAIARTKFGSFAIVCKDVNQFLDGYKVRLSIGNLTSARFDGTKIFVKWGKSFLKNKEISVTDSFFPGRYTTIEVVITPAKPEDVKELIVTLKFNIIGLY